MDNPILYQALGGLMIVFFLVLIYFFTRTWRWFQIVCVVFVFFASIFLVRNTAAVYRTLDVWRSDLAKTTPQIAKLEEDNYRLRYGSTDDTQQTVESLRLLRAKIGRVTLDMGRVWRHCTPSPPQPDGSIVVNTVPAQPAAAVDPAAAPPDGTTPAPAAPTPNLIQDQTVLHAFLEQVPPKETGAPEGRKVPFYYLGDFVAVATTDTSVTLQPLTPLHPEDRALLKSATTTWALYETMPVDAHEFFTDNPDQEPKWQESAQNDSARVFGSVSPETQKSIEATLKVPRFFPNFFSTPAEYQAASQLLGQATQQYLNDGKRIENKDEYDPSTVWTKVRFLKSKKEVVDSGAAVSPFNPGVTDDFFDRNGMAEVAILRLGQEAEFQENDVAILPQDDAKQLIDSGVCKFEEYIYVRPLNDYGFLFRNFDERFDRIADDQEKINRNIAELTDAQANVNRQIELANSEQAKLQADLVKTREEAARIAKYHAMLEAQWAKTREKLSQLYQTNLQLEERLERGSLQPTAAAPGHRPAAAGS